jgi:hypothetical protein
MDDDESLRVPFESMSRAWRLRQKTVDRALALVAADAASRPPAEGAAAEGAGSRLRRMAESVRVFAALEEDAAARLSARLVARRRAAATAASAGEAAAAATPAAPPPPSPSLALMAHIAAYA